MKEEVVEHKAVQARLRGLETLLPGINPNLYSFANFLADGLDRPILPSALPLRVAQAIDNLSWGVGWDGKLLEGSPLVGLSGTEYIWFFAMLPKMASVVLPEPAYLLIRDYYEEKFPPQEA